jgi:hypothetical protein
MTNIRQSHPAIQNAARRVEALEVICKEGASED